MNSSVEYESEKVLEDNLIKQLKADSLIKICTTLNCSFDDIVEIINNEE
jgi:DNA-binding Xre family transcriptional regulator